MQDEGILSAYFEDLFAAETGWRLGKILAWLLTRGRRMADPSAFLDALSAQLLAEGAPIWRFRISVSTIHPRIAAWGLQWVRGGGGAREWAGTHGIRQTDTYIGSPIHAIHRHRKPVRKKLQSLRADQDHTVYFEIARDGGVDYIAIPMVFSDGETNVATFATDRADGFEDSDIRKLEALTEALAPILEAHAAHRISVALLDTYLGPRTGARVLRGSFRRGDGETIDAALWFSDLRDFTVLTENLPVRDVLATLNTYFEYVAAAVTARGGEILRFIGDAMLIVFATDVDRDARSACAAALDAAEDAFASLATVNAIRQRHGEPPIRFGVGLHVGQVVYGNVGAPDRLDFTVMGPAVNRTARLEGLTKSLDRPLLMSSEFAAYVERAKVSMGTHPMRGVATPQEVFAVPDGLR